MMIAIGIAAFGLAACALISISSVLFPPWKRDYREGRLDLSSSGTICVKARLKTTGEWVTLHRIVNDYETTQTGRQTFASYRYKTEAAWIAAAMVSVKIVDAETYQDVVVNYSHCGSEFERYVEIWKNGRWI